MTTFAGVDGGGTRVRAVVTDSVGKILSRAEGRGSVATASGPETTVRAVVNAVTRAMKSAGQSDPLTSLWAGLAGVGDPDVRDAVRHGLLASGLSNSVEVGSDARAAHYAAFGEAPGVLLIAGTGSVGWARGVDGSMTRAGGWGGSLGDEGSGYKIGIEGLVAVLRAHDGRGPDTSLTSTLLESCNLSDPRRLVAWVDLASKRDVAALAPHVLSAADGGDAVAVEIRDRALAQLLEIVSTLATPGDSVHLSGGLAGEGGPLSAELSSTISATGWAVSTAVLDVAAAAAELARKHQGTPKRQ